MNQLADRGKHAWEIFPFAMQASNALSADHLYRGVRIPDVDPAELLKTPGAGDLSMAAGDFLEVYAATTQVNVVATLFFLDTAVNVLDYLACIHRMLAIGGLWIHCGPLLNHWSDDPSVPQIELSWEQIRRVVTQHYGMEVLYESHSSTQFVPYIYDCKSL